MSASDPPPALGLWTEPCANPRCAARQRASARSGCTPAATSARPALGADQAPPSERAEPESRRGQRMELLGRLASGVAHDFNNLMTVISACSELALATLEPEHAITADLLDINHAARRASVLAGNLLKFGRGQALSPRTSDASAVVRGIGKMLRRVIGRGVELRVEATAPLQTLADPGHLEQVVTNLALNARDAMPNGGILTLSTAAAELGEAQARALDVAPGAYVALTVTDTGSGMDDATLARMYEPYFTTKGPLRGTGLGLSTVQAIVIESKGALEVESAIGRGTSFRVLLPAVDAR